MTDSRRLEVSGTKGRLTKFGFCSYGGLETMMKACIAALAAWATAPVRKMLDSHRKRSVADVKKSRVVEETGRWCLDVADGYAHMMFSTMTVESAWLRLEARSLSTMAGRDSLCMLATILSSRYCDQLTDSCCRERSKRVDAGAQKVVRA